MKTIQLHISLFFILIWSFSFAQQYENYTIKNGLPSNHIYRITQDYDGFIWIITNKGISKFDGKNFKNFTVKNGLPTNDIWQIRVTPDNKIWYFSKATKLGYIYNDKVYAFSSKTKKVLYPITIVQAKNTIGFYSSPYYYTLKDSIWKRTTNPTYPRRHKVIHPIVKYIGIYNYNNIIDSIYFYKKKSKKTLPLPHGGSFLKKVNEQGQINDSLHIYISNNHYNILNLNTIKTHNYSYSSQNLQKTIKHFRFHNVNNEIQFTGMNFVSYLGINGTLKNTVTIPKELNSHFSFIDKTGNIWSATFNKGIYLLPKEKQETQIFGKNKKTQHLKLNDHKLYACIYKEGFFELKDTLIPIIKNKEYQYRISAIDTLALTFFSSEHKIYTLKNKKTTTLSQSNKYIYNDLARELIHFKGFLYGNNSYGIVKISFNNYTIKEQYPLHGVSSFSKTNTQLFTGNQAGLFLFKKDSFTKLNQQNLFNKPVLCQTQLNNNTIVVGTEGYGAYITNGINTQLIENSDNYNVQNIFIDTSKNIWLATNEGVHKAQGKAKNYKIVESFYETDGIISNNINDIAVKNDTLFTATDIGISLLPLKQPKTNQLQKLYIKSIKTNTQSFESDSINFKYKKNDLLSVSFGTINFSNQNNLTYQYKLQPSQQEWVTTNTPEINFTNLKPNTYYLDLKVTNHHQDEALKTITIKVLPLWYQTSFFKIFSLLFFLVLIYFLYQWNKNRIEKKATQKSEIQQKLAEQELYALRSQMNPHFVFNSLNAIQYYITKNEIDLSEKYLVKFSRLIRMFFDFSSEKTITIDQETKLLKNYLEIEKMRFGKDFKYQFLIDKYLNLNTQIPTMLLQPIVENAVNHGIFHNNRKGTIIIQFNYINTNQFEVIIEDDGVGLKKTLEIKAKSLKKHQSKSTSIIKDRIELMNTSKDWKITHKIVDLTTGINSGTKVVLLFKKLI